MSISQVIAHACVVFAGVIIGAVVAKFIDFKMLEHPNLYRFYVTFICVNSKGKRIYKSRVVDLHRSNPTEEEIQDICKGILEENPGYKDCAVMSWVRLSPSSSKDGISDVSVSNEVSEEVVEKVDDTAAAEEAVSEES